MTTNSVWFQGLTARQQAHVAREVALEHPDQKALTRLEWRELHRAKREELYGVSNAS